MPLGVEVLEFLRSLRKPVINDSTLNDESRILIAKKFREFNEKGILYTIQDIDNWVEMAKPSNERCASKPPKAVAPKI